MSDNHGSNINAFLFGVMVGGLLGVLFAPDEGKETRRKLKENWREWSRRALELAEGLQEEVGQGVEQAVGTLEPIVHEVQSQQAVQPSSEPSEGGPLHSEGVYGKEVRGEVGRSLPEAKEGLDQAVRRARAELRKRVRRPRPQFFRGV